MRPVTSCPTLYFSAPANHQDLGRGAPSPLKAQGKRFLAQIHSWLILQCCLPLLCTPPLSTPATLGPWLLN